MQVFWQLIPGIIYSAKSLLRSWSDYCKTSQEKGRMQKPDGKTICHIGYFSLVDVKNTLISFHFISLVAVDTNAVTVLLSLTRTVFFFT
jgi:hypothetical protein